MVRENNLTQKISWYCWPFFPSVKLLHPLPFKDSRSHKNCDFESETFRLPIHVWSLNFKVWSKVLCDRIHRLPNLTIWVCFSLMFLPEVAYYATNNPNHVFFSFFPKFLKVCFHTILNKSKNIVFHVNFLPLPCMCLWLTSGFNL